MMPVDLTDTCPSFLFVASLFEDQPMLVDMTNAIPVKRTLPSAPKRSPLSTSDDVANTKQALQDSKQTTCVTIFTASGSHVLAGTSKGWLNIISTTTCQTIYSTRLCNGVVIFLRLSTSGRDMVVNSSDRIIRTIHMPSLSEPDLDPDGITIEVEHKFQDVVNRLSWNHVAFSSTGEYVTASTYKNHDIYVWERSHGSLVKILEGPKEELGVVEVSCVSQCPCGSDLVTNVTSQWHPHRPYVAACGLESGQIYLWGINTPQRWSALAPDFAEVEENVEYLEKEDEFDIHPIAVIHKRRLDKEDEDVDVLTIEPVKGGEWDNGEQDGPLMGEPSSRSAFRMPVLLDLSDSESEEEIVAVGPGTMKRKSPGAGQAWAEGESGGSGDDGKGHAAKKPAATNGTSKRNRKR